MRLILDSPASGGRNMALDEALLEAVAGGLAPPTLRFYTFERPTLTLGYSQALSAADRAACAEAGVEVARRPTGGRAVLHDRDLTYSVVQPVLTGESVGESYCRLSRAIAAAIGQLGLVAEVAKATRQPSGQERPVDCFAVSTGADLVVRGRKLVGSAQVRRRGVMLQHGSIRLVPGRPLPHLAPGALSLAEALGIAEPYGPWLDAIRDRLERAIARKLAVSWEPALWMPPEIALADAIAGRTASGPRPLEPPPGRPAAG